MKNQKGRKAEVLHVVVLVAQLLHLLLDATLKLAG